MVFYHILTALKKLTVIFCSVSSEWYSITYWPPSNGWLWSFVLFFLSGILPFIIYSAPSNWCETCLCCIVSGLYIVVVFSILSDDLYCLSGIFVVFSILSDDLYCLSGIFVVFSILSDDLYYLSGIFIKICSLLLILVVLCLSYILIMMSCTLPSNSYYSQTCV
jgi:hypothetical protein